MDNEEFSVMLEMKRLLSGLKGLSHEKVKAEICPQCPFRSGICDFMMELALNDVNIRFACRGMRAWVTGSN